MPPKDSVYAKNKTNNQYHFDKVYDLEISQKDFFSATIHPCLEKVLNGKSLLVFNYGVTNSGKSYTMQGTHSLKLYFYTVD
jgi:hypothetical protein